MVNLCLEIYNTFTWKIWFNLNKLEIFLDPNYDIVRPFLVPAEGCRLCGGALRPSFVFRSKNTFLAVGGKQLAGDRRQVVGGSQ